MKVFFLSNSYPNRDNRRSGEYNVRLVNQIKDKGEGIIVSFFRMWRPGRRIISRYIHDDIEVLQVCLPLIPGKGYFLFRINIFICELLGGWLLRKEIRFCDIIHSVSLCPNGIIASYWAERFNKLHISQAIGSDVNFDMAMVVKNHFTVWIRNINGIIANSNALEKKIRNTFPIFSEIRTIYRGVPTDFIKNSANEYIQKSGISFLYLGGFVKGDSLKKGLDVKGGATLALAWEKAEVELFPLNASLSIGGPGADKAWLYEWCYSLQHPERVEIIGELFPAIAKEWMRRSDVIIIPSMYEGLPNVLLESSSYKKVVVGSDAGGIPEVIINGETGYIFKRGDYCSLAKLLVEVAKDKQRIPLMGQKAYERVNSFFNANNYGDSVCDFYNSMRIRKVSDTHKMSQL